MWCTTVWDYEFVKYFVSSCIWKKTFRWMHFLRAKLNYDLWNHGVGHRCIFHVINSSPHSQWTLLRFNTERDLPVSILCLSEILFIRFKHKCWNLAVSIVEAMIYHYKEPRLKSSWFHLTYYTIYWRTMLIVNWIEPNVPHIHIGQPRMMVGQVRIALHIRQNLWQMCSARSVTRHTTKGGGGTLQRRHL